MTIMSPKVVSKAARLHVTRKGPGTFEVESDSAESRIVSNTVLGLKCTCGVGGDECSHRLAVKFFREQEGQDSVDTEYLPFNVDDFTGEQLNAMSLYELGCARNMVTAVIAEIGKVLRVEIDENAVYAVAMNRAKLEGRVVDEANAKESYILSRAKLDALKNRQSVAKSIMSSLQTAMRTAQMAGG
jgi:hypothetical protein